MTTSNLKHAFLASLPVMFGYVPLGMAFGILFQNLGFHWYYAAVMSIFVFAGAAQFMAVGLLAANAGLLEMAIATFALNSRHMFFGLSLLKRYHAKGLKKFYLMFGLTDETYSLVTSTHSPSGEDDQNYYLALTAMNHSYWVAGSALGALLGASIEFDSTGMDFALPALFMVLVIEQWKKIKNPVPFVIALGCGIFSIWFFNEQMLLVSIGLSISILLMAKSSMETAK